MPRNLSGALDALEEVAAYEGPWRPLRAETPRLRERLGELRDRADRINDVLVVALLGGSGVGKSTLINAIAGDQLAKTSAYRPCTTRPALYHPPGVRMDFPDWDRIPGSALEHLVIVDTPDSDSIVHEHRARVEEVLRQCDLILLCGSPEKYLDEATWSMLRPLHKERALVCVETKARGEDSIREHWLGRMAEAGLRVDRYFRVNALRTLDRKLTGAEPGAEELDFTDMERFFEQELTRERIARIKQTNISGLLTKSVMQVQEALDQRAGRLDHAEDRVDKAARELAARAQELLEDRVFGEPHLWLLAMGREMALRLRGFTGACYRLMEMARTLPVRLAGWMPGLGFGRPRAGRQAADLLVNADAGAFTGELEIAAELAETQYHEHASAVAVAMSRAEFDGGGEAAGRAAYREELSRRVAGILRGPARDSIARLARRAAGWPAYFATDMPLIGFFAVAAYAHLARFVQGMPAHGNLVGASLTVLVVWLTASLYALGALTRGIARLARKEACGHLRAALFASPLAFQAEKGAIAEARNHLAAVKRLREQLEA